MHLEYSSFNFTLVSASSVLYNTYKAKFYHAIFMVSSLSLSEDINLRYEMYSKDFIHVYNIYFFGTKLVKVKFVLLIF